MGRIAVVLAALVVTSVVVTSLPRQRDIRFIVGKYKEMPPLETPTPVPAAPTATPAPVVTLVPTPYIAASTPRPNPLVPPALVVAPQRVAPAAPVDKWSFKAPSDLRFFLVIGSDARHWQDMVRARADSIHIVAVDPKSREGTVLGIPRDSYVNIPGYGRQKINAALVYGGPNLLVKALRDLTHMPISHYAVTGFHGIDKIVDTLLGVDVYVPYRMKDRYSGADFEKGWRHMNGREVLAFSRARHGVPGGDFGRSKNQGSVILASLKKMRAEVKNRDQLRKWVNVLFDHAKLDMSVGEAMELGVLARKLFPADFTNLVTPGKGQTIGGQSVVVLGDDAKALFKDVGMDAVVDGDTRRQDPAPTPTPKPRPTPTAAPGLLPTSVPAP